MNLKLLEFAIEQLHRDPDLLNQETKTAIKKAFGDRKKVDDLIGHLRTSSWVMSMDYRRETNIVIMEMSRKEEKLNRQINELQQELRNANYRIKCMEFEEQLREQSQKSGSAQAGDRLNVDQNVKSKSGNTKNRKVRVWLGGNQVEPD